MPPKQKFSVAIVAGSKKSDGELVEESGIKDILTTLGIPWTLCYLSAHKHKRRSRRVEISFKEAINHLIGRGAKVFIAIAGMAAALAGDIAAESLRMPILGVALSSKEFPDAMDSVLSMIRMPYPVPVMFMGIGKAGLTNAAIGAAQIIGLSDEKVRETLVEFLINEIDPPSIDYETWP